MAAYLAIASIIATVAVLLATTYLFSWLLSPGRHPVAAGNFVAGGHPQEHAMSRFHVRWYLVALLFIAFDMEMIFMYPWAVVVADIGFMALIEMGMFLLILSLGILYAWREGALRWT